AAPGGKSLTLAGAMRDDGEIVACDIVPARLERLSENVRRAELKSVRSQLLSPDENADAIPLGEFDAALVDAPCSNSGVFARRPEARLRFRASVLEKLEAIQRHVFARGAQRVRPGGRLVYSTCSVESRENENRVREFLAKH